MVKQVTRSELQAKLAASPTPILVEALPEKYYRDRHLPQALHLPHDQVDVLAPSLLPDKSAEVIVYCANKSCNNSHIAAQRLTQLGYAAVAVYSGGKQDWIEAGLPVESADDTATA